MPGVWVPFFEVELVPGRQLTATFEAEVTYRDARNWDLDDVKLATWTPDASRMTAFETLPTGSLVWTLLRDYARSAGAVEIERRIERDIADAGGLREMGRMAAE